MRAGGRRYEPWAHAAFAVGLLTLVMVLYLGWRPGGTAPVLVYRWGPLAVSACAAALLLFALGWCALHRPVLQPGRAAPLAVLAVSLWFCSLPIAYPSSYQGRPSPTRFRLPFHGEARVRLQGAEGARNRLLFDPSRRYGTGFEPKGEGPLEVVAPVAGRVERLDALEGQGFALVIAVGEREYLFLAGLESSSVSVHPGQVVEAGERLGRAAGLFVHLQEGAVIGRFEGIPVRYSDCSAGGRELEPGIPVAGQVLGPAGALHVPER
jgi:hypothetical protein